MPVSCPNYGYRSLTVQPYPDTVLVMLRVWVVGNGPCGRPVLCAKGADVFNSGPLTPPVETPLAYSAGAYSWAPLRNSWCCRRCYQFPISFSVRVVYPGEGAGPF